jgi:hypothetical protein
MMGVKGSGRHVRVSRLVELYEMAPASKPARPAVAPRQPRIVCSIERDRSGHRYTVVAATAGLSSLAFHTLPIAHLPCNRIDLLFHSRSRLQILSRPC